MTAALLERISVRDHRVRDPADARRAMTAALSGLELEPLELGPAAILIVRRIADPAPGAALDPARARGWRGAVQTRVAELERRAARPVRARPGAACDAVLFADDGELLACLAAAATDGSLASDWWWRHWRSTPQAAAQSAPGIAAVAWRAAPWAAPAAVAVLGAARAAAFFAALTDAEVTTLARSLGVRFALAPAWWQPPEAVAAPEAAAVDRARGGGAPPRDAQAPRTPSNDAGPAEETTVPAWALVAPELSVAVGARPSQRATLLGVLLALHRAPRLLHGPLRIAPPALARLTPPGRRAQQQGPASATVAEDVGRIADWTAPARVTRTALGGAFLLAAVGQARGLFPDFTAPADPGSEPGVWGWLAATAAHLAGHRPDPLWALLAELDAESPAPPGARPIRGGLRADAQATARHLARALGTRPRAAGRRVLTRAADVHVAAGRLDVIFSLEDIDVAMRVAGLDRDPGWLPTAHTHLRLHYR
jgi:hypothetical protein